VPRRVLYVNAVGMLGGAERSLALLVRALDRARFEPAAAVPADSPLAEELERCGAEVVGMPSVRLRRAVELRPWAHLARAVRAVRRAAKQTGAALIHANSTASCIVAAPAAAAAGLPCIWHARDLKGHALVRHALRRTTRSVICVSEAVRQAVGVPAVVIHNGIDADEFAASAQPGALRREFGMGDAPLVVMAAQMVPWKGHDVFIRAAALLRQMHPRLKAAIAGSDMFGEHADYCAAIQRLIEENGLGECVLLLGQRADVATLMADADVVVSASDAEPFGRVALEAMAVGRPVVGTRAGGLPEVVADGETGILVQPRDPQALADAVSRLLADGALRTRMGQRGHALVRERFSIEAHARAVERVYEDVMAGV
jgi:glycosyltransferase involved in cell wall biosynthesis